MNSISLEFKQNVCSSRFVWVEELNDSRLDEVESVLSWNYSKVLKPLLDQQKVAVIANVF